MCLYLSDAFRKHFFHGIFTSLQIFFRPSSTAAASFSLHKWKVEALEARAWSTTKQLSIDFTIFFPRFLWLVYFCWFHVKHLNFSIFFPLSLSAAASLGEQERRESVLFLSTCKGLKRENKEQSIAERCTLLSNRMENCGKNEYFTSSHPNKKGRWRKHTANRGKKTHIHCY